MCSYRLRQHLIPQLAAVLLLASAEDPEDDVAAAADEDDDVPLGIVAKLPSDDELKGLVLDILRTVDVQEFSIKALMSQLGKLWGGWL